MKKKNLQTLTATIHLVWLLTLPTLIACNGQNAPTGQDISLSGGLPAMDIHTAVVTGNVEALRQHIDAGTNLNEKDPFGGSSPLTSAALFGQTEMAGMLIKAGADINFQNKDGSTALHLASFFCRPEIVSLLLKNGADKSIKNNFNSTAYESVAVPFKDVKQVYEMMEKMLGPMGLKLDYAYIEKTRPEIATLLK